MPRPKKDYQSLNVNVNFRYCGLKAENNPLFWFVFTSLRTSASALRHIWHFCFQLVFGSCTISV